MHEITTFDRDSPLKNPAKISSLYTMNKYFEHIPTDVCPGK